GRGARGGRADPHRDAGDPRGLRTGRIQPGYEPGGGRRGRHRRAPAPARGAALAGGRELPARRGAHQGHPDPAGRHASAVRRRMALSYHDRGRPGADVQGRGPGPAPPTGGEAGLSVTSTTGSPTRPAPPGADGPRDRYGYDVERTDPRAPGRLGASRTPRKRRRPWVRWVLLALSFLMLA